MNLLSSASYLVYLLLISRILGYLKRYLDCNFFRSFHLLLMLFLSHLDYQILLEDYLQKEHLMQLLYQVIHLQKLQDKKKGKKFADDVLGFLLLILLFIVTIS